MVSPVRDLLGKQKVAGFIPVGGFYFQIWSIIYENSSKFFLYKNISAYHYLMGLGYATCS